MSPKKIFQPFLFLMIFLFGINVANAAEMAFYGEAQDIALNQEFQTGLYLSTDNENINALEGAISFPGELLELKEIRDGDSIVNFWVKRPKLPDQANGSGIIFSGVVVGGYNGSNGKLFSLVFRVKKAGRATIAIEKARAFLNDGKATVAQLTLKNYSFRIKRAGAQAHGVAIVSPLVDNIPPEPFDPVISRDPNIFNGQYALVFATQDKGSGIDHYEVREGDDAFIKAESPYLLKNQKMDKPVIVRAYDKAGNTRDAFYSPQGAGRAAAGAGTQSPLRGSTQNWPWLAGLIMLAALYAALRSARRK